MASTTAPLGNRVDINLKRAFEATAEDLGLSATSALTVFMKRFVEEGGFPFDVRRRVPSESEYTAEMDARHRSMRNGNEAEHDLVEI
ncbi:type II toxin-antitoxin system RelB/DinJ family antitoxin [Collinsella tanakaei]|uniref:type II toxin-antitoxin system RelB/DinJ family antitoxin n=1 Tax=Collinsella tanakaei TaxID=626935 RepID=UPI0025A48F3C|nr:type II toxin-antitoxin system RelB/DinJ family antitoxin [Collinsella tanakaei]MDM8300341.1 type II toxin-antitoxin system RelB/DinJ family antitoxin [Collinsella tanakaei]